MSAATVFETLDQVRAAVGRHLGSSEWVELTPQRVQAYAAATGDRDGDGRVPALFVLALTNLFLPQILEVRGASTGVNYGTGDIRFPTPVAVGSRLRGRADLVACDEVRAGIQTTIRITVEIEGQADPACVVDSLSRWLA